MELNIDDYIEVRGLPDYEKYSLKGRIVDLEWSRDSSFKKICKGITVKRDSGTCFGIMDILIKNHVFIIKRKRYKLK